MHAQGATMWRAMVQSASFRPNLSRFLRSPVDGCFVMGLCKVWMVGLVQGQVFVFRWLRMPLDGCEAGSGKRAGTEEGARAEAELGVEAGCNALYIAGCVCNQVFELSGLLVRGG